MLYRSLALCVLSCVCGASAAQIRPADDVPALKLSRSASLQRLAASGARPPAAARVSAARASAVHQTSAPASLALDNQVRVLLIANLETTVSSPATARIVRLNAATGSAFGAGQVLVAFDCDEPTARLRIAEAELAGAQETLDAKLRMQGLEQASEVEVATAAATVAKARGQIALHKAQIGQCTITAPWPGRVAKMHVRNHMSVTPGQPLLDLVKSGPLRLKLNLPSRLVADVKPGAPLSVTIDETGKTYDARVSAVNGRVDAESQTVEIEAALTRSYAELLPGMSGVAHSGALR